ncbi:EF-P 5-aminopentanol modification-associated protein YfmF [Paenibacillus gansuensis]|uniref:EF-P 5-aminopentanol modification-associated protein YfmF n=1 Tax=Paenibacillus gansuensis TaxID=306542 RepID=A0ABW5PCJ9_9BACL
MTNQGFERTTVNGIRLHVMPTQRFKTFAVSVYIGHPLTEEKVTATALAPFVLRRGTATYPETQQFRERLDDLYGAGFGFDIYKRGDNQIVQFRMDTIHDQFVKQQSSSLLAESLQFLGEVITNPLVEDGAFSRKYVEAEKNTLKKKLESIVNDKIRYAAERNIEEMCKDEPYRLHPLGRIGDLQGITPQSLYQSYMDWLRTSPIDVYVVGDTSLEAVSELVQKHFSVERGDIYSYDVKPVQREAGEVRTIVEKMDVNQGKLNMGLRARTSYSDENYPAALMYNGILGGYPHSKLFVNVREKESLAYYAASRLDGHKGILTIQSGIEIDNFEKATDIIRKQLDSMAAGDISELELSQTKAMLGNSLREMLDSAFEMISFDFSSVLSGKERSAGELIQRLEQVGVPDIQAFAKQVSLETIYFLRDQKGE